MVMGESAGNENDMAAVLWCMSSLFVPAGQNAKYGLYFNTFTSLLKAYSQPINPIWRRDGTRCRPGGPNHTRNNCSENRLRRRDRISTIEWHQIPENVRIITLAWAYGLLENPVPRAIEFADHNVSSSFLRASPGSECPDDYKIRNWFIKTGQRIRQGKSGIPERLWSKNWPEDVMPRIEAENPPRRGVHARTQSTPAMRS